MALTLGDLAERLSARLLGDGAIPITGAAEPADAGPTDLALAMRPAYADGLARGRARAAILWEGADHAALGLDGALIVSRPRYAMALVTQAVDPGPRIAPGIHPSAFVDPAADLGPGAAIGPFAVIGAGAVIGPGARIAAHASIGPGSRLGADALIGAGARVAHDVWIGDRVILHPNCVVGSDGFAFVTPERSGVEAARETLAEGDAPTPQSWTRIHSLGGVEIGDDVEIGAATCVDRGTIRATRIAHGCKIDNLVQIGHNAVLGRDCLVAGQAGVAGSAVLGERVVLGGASGVADNLTVGDDVVITGATKVASNVPKGRVMMGYPAVRIETHTEMYKALRRLPRVIAGLRGGKPVSKGDISD